MFSSSLQYGPRLVIGLSLAASCPSASPVDRAPIHDEHAQRSPPQRRAASDEYAAARATMVSTQIAARGVRDPRVLAAMRRVPRHRFVPRSLHAMAHADQPLPIGEGQTISQPYIVAFMSEALRIDPKMRVLEIGTGSGYQAAVLAQLCHEVFSIEIVAALGERARKRLRRLGYDNVSVRIGDGYRGWPGQAPFDRIILTAAPPRIPRPLLAQLRPGGILVAPEGRTWQHLVRITKTASGFKRERLLGVRFVPMTGRAQRVEGAPVP